MTELVFFSTVKGRRAIAVRLIDQRRGGVAMEGHFYERKAALLAKEDQIEAEFEKMVTLMETCCKKQYLRTYMTL